MGLRDRLRRLQKAARGNLASFELASGERFWFELEKTWGVLFDFWAESVRADVKRRPRPQPPEILRAVADARDRAAALDAVYPPDVVRWIPLDEEALVQHGELVHRSLASDPASPYQPVEDPSK